MFVELNPARPGSFRVHSGSLNSFVRSMVFFGFVWRSLVRVLEVVRFILPRPRCDSAGPECCRVHSRVESGVPWASSSSYWVGFAVPSISSSSFGFISARPVVHSESFGSFRSTLVVIVFIWES